VSRGWRIALIASACLAGFVYLNREGLLFAVAVSSSDTRPDLLADAKWNRADSATAFRRRFHPGVEERELVSWLRDNRFTLVSASREATRLIESLPCNERIAVAWLADQSGKLTSANATVTEAGCL
jgi:hypothetical protein